MYKKRGFALIEAIFMIVFISVALLLVYKAFATSFQDEKKRVKYDNTEMIYKTYFLKQYFEENGLDEYLTSVTLNNGYLEINCNTLTSVNKEYCSFLTSSDNFNVTKMYITKLDMSGITYNSLDATTIDYMKTLSSKDTASYRFIVWYADGEYASLKIGDPFYYARFYLDGGSWSGISPQKLMEGDTSTLEMPTKEGYIFNGWNIIGSGSTVINNVLTMGTEDVSLVATWHYPEYEFLYTGSYQLFTVPLNGYYKAELYGAAGGESLYTTQYFGGKGGYTSGVTYLNVGEKLYIYVGGKGQTVSGTTTGTLTANSNGYNGGGYGAFAASNNDKGGGGGATDIRYFGSTTPTSSDLLWNSTLGLNSRIMVAGGGGGSSSHVNTPNYSGTGGGGGNLIGGSGVYASSTCYAFGYGGSQIAGGGSTNCPSDGQTYSSLGAFGVGHTPYTAYNSNGNVAGGGGGYYGGGGGYHAPAGGGSSFISGYAGVNAITSSSSTVATNNTIHYSNKYFINSSVISGVSSGNGSAKITYAGTTLPTKLNTNLNNVRYIKDCVNANNTGVGDEWVELQAIYQGINVAKGKTVTGTIAQNASYPYTRITDGDITSANYAAPSSYGLQCITVDLGQIYNLDEIAVWHYWLDGRTYYSNTTSVSSDNSTWNTAISNLTAETSQGKRVNTYTKPYFYTGGSQTFTAPYTGYYQIEAWGASGGNGNATYKGGMGGYTKGKIYLTANDNLYIYAGGVGPAIGNATNTTGGYNGGGGCFTGGSNYVSGCGGGATDIRLTSGTWNNATSLASRIMVAGAGGGGHYRSDTSSYGGSAGGLSGNPSSGDTSGYARLYSTGGSQTAGGAKGYVDASSRITSLTDSGFGYGGSLGSPLNDWNFIGGGGGYWGGGSGVFMSGAAGSSYISGHTGCVAITSSSSTSPRLGTGGAACSQGGTDNLCSIHYSEKYFTNTLMIDGSGYTWTNTKASTYGTNIMPRVVGGNYDAGWGNIGDGAVAITYLDS